ncbi:MAG TPA: DUF4231 domain-containing protein [Allocoleopsis sp.]
MAKPPTYRQILRKELAGLIDQLEMSERNKTFMKSRWLDQLIWLEGKAEKLKQRFELLRITTIVGGVIIPALVSLNIDGNVAIYLRWGTFGLSQMVAISAALDGFFRDGDRHSQYRNTAETLKIEGWQFFQLSGPYDNADSHQEVYTTFADRVETIIKKDVETYIAEALQKKKDQKTKPSEGEVAQTNPEKPESINN